VNVYSAVVPLDVFCNDVDLRVV